jgi:hypothetical protein
MDKQEFIENVKRTLIYDSLIEAALEGEEMNSQIGDLWFGLMFKLKKNKPKISINEVAEFTNWYSFHEWIENHAGEYVDISENIMVFLDEISLIIDDLDVSQVQSLGIFKISLYLSSLKK